MREAGGRLSTGDKKESIEPSRLNSVERGEREWAPSLSPPSRRPDEGPRNLAPRQARPDPFHRFSPRQRLQKCLSLAPLGRRRPLKTNTGQDAAKGKGKKKEKFDEVMHRLPPPPPLSKGSGIGVGEGLRGRVRPHRDGEASEKCLCDHRLN